MIRERRLNRGAGPEHNLIQNPELVRTIQQGVGVRQSHVTPVLADTIQPVVIAHDVRDIPSASTFPKRYAATINIIGNAAAVPNASICNPLSSGRIVSVREIHTFVDTGTLGTLTYLYYSFVATSNVEVIARKGQGLTTGTAIPGSPFAAGVPNSPVGLLQENGTVLGGAWYWALFGGATGAPVEVKEEYDNLLIYPGGKLSVGIGDINGAGWVNFQWDEYPLS